MARGSPLIRAAGLRVWASLIVRASFATSVSTSRMPPAAPRPRQGFAQACDLAQRPANDGFGPSPESAGNSTSRSTRDSREKRRP
jgi:hypothetical protein